MKKIFYVDSKILSKTAREKYSHYTMVSIAETLPYNKVKVDTYYFDIPCAYAPANKIGTDVIDERKIKTLNWDAILNDLKEGDSNRKYWYWHFLNKTYNCDAYFKSFGSTLLNVYWDNVVIATLDISKLAEEHPWCKNQYILVKLDIVLKYMIENHIDEENASKLLEMIHSDDVVITTEESLTKKGLIN